VAIAILAVDASGTGTTATIDGGFRSIHNRVRAAGRGTSTIDAGIGVTVEVYQTELTQLALRAFFATAIDIGFLAVLFQVHAVFDFADAGLTTTFDAIAVHSTKVGRTGVIHARIALTVGSGFAATSRKTFVAVLSATIEPCFVAILHAIGATRSRAEAVDARIATAIRTGRTGQALCAYAAGRTSAINVCFGTVFRRIATGFVAEEHLTICGETDCQRC
jgi:hypothetical protein